MPKRFFVAFIASVVASASVFAQKSDPGVAQSQGAPLHLVQTLVIPPAVNGNFDHLGIDLKRNRLFATPENSKALATGELFGIDGKHFLRAITLGYDIGTRVSMTLGGLQFQMKTHRSSHSIANNFGAAAAAGCSAGLGVQQMRWLMDYAAQQASGIAAWQRDTHHVEKSFVFGGAPARNGVDAALLIHIGANGVDDIFSGSDNFLTAFGPEADPAGIGGRPGRTVRGYPNQY